jgi:hypothetical protein
MNLTGDSALGPVVMRLNTRRPSLGQIEEIMNNNPGKLDLPPFNESGTADSFYDVFVEMEVGGNVLHNEVPLRLIGVISHKPPAADDVFENRENIELLGPDGQPVGVVIGVVRYIPSKLPDVIINLNTGWNLISLNLQPTNTAIAGVLGFVADNCNSAWAYNNGWKAYYPAYPEYSDLETMEAGWGYWLNMSEPAALIVSGFTPTKTISLNQGWNLVGYNSSDPLPVDKALKSIAEDCESVWQFKDGAWKAYYTAYPEYSDLKVMEPKYGYWIKTTAKCTWTLP